jgi:hypothetical protein
MEAIVSMHVNMASIFDECYLSRYRPGYNFPENNATQVKFSNKLWLPCIISKLMIIHVIKLLVLVVKITIQLTYGFMALKRRKSRCGYVFNEKANRNEFNTIETPLSTIFQL